MRYCFAAVSDLRYPLVAYVSAPCGPSFHSITTLSLLCLCFQLPLVKVGVLAAFEALGDAVSAVYAKVPLSFAELDRRMRKLGSALLAVLGPKAERPNLHILLHQAAAAERFGSPRNYCTSAYERR